MTFLVNMNYTKNGEIVEGKLTMTGERTMTSSRLKWISDPNYSAGWISNTRICQAWSVWVSSSFSKKFTWPVWWDREYAPDLELWSRYWRSTSRTARYVFEILKSDRIENSKHQSMRAVFSISTYFIAVQRYTLRADVVEVLKKRNYSTLQQFSERVFGHGILLIQRSSMQSYRCRFDQYNRRSSKIRRKFCSRTIFKTKQRTKFRNGFWNRRCQFLKLRCWV